ncbi:hypothetical protein E5F05_19275 [Deinococcus metallilatus]|uniref:Uncharacterized protein n=1 Tax=Deinococcus metallilatus TaxID=1211322 RepID=A0AAJ5F2Z1_9DEIO|nr:hypothetical protein [Deinococcus metallilatus]MBB5296438.1 hypothetical protein [Deinococcus metallilatus]QBY09892.1 hypothetical protein E5F05_19275 [Deinococcus metallilatus]RXJ08616.1 hypothetical protein ERJ73_18115 [Deinococcus metallilatus]TLK25090.1 hypothetical protein FCS05_13030 [Deinococcus metallilatus]GMA14649.1 hypothetical protein GCM10025871_09800 [Deinococcus metallilatus]
MLTLAEAARFPEMQVGAETHRLAAHPDRVPAAMLLPAAFEEEFYRRANLPEQLARLLAPLNPARLDEDLLEELAEKAQALVRGSSLLDDAVQLFYRALGNAGLSVGEVHVRRPGGREVEAARVTPPGTPALHAVKRLWARDWTFEALLARLDDTGSIGLEARPTLLLAGPPGRPDANLAAELGTGAALVNGLGLVGLPDR